MFFNLIWQSRKRNKKQNSLVFVSLIVAIVASYIILSLEYQGVIIFLKTMESGAIDKLLTVIPIVYFVSMFFMFFLIYFTSKYQMDCRNREFGIYLNLGMSRKKLFLMLVVEEIWSSIISLVIGITTSIFLSEMISLITSKFVADGIIKNNFTISIKPIIVTSIGYITIRIVALIILSGRFIKKDIESLLKDNQEQKRKKRSNVLGIMLFILGVLFLGYAYKIGMEVETWRSFQKMLTLIVTGIVGTFLIFYALNTILEVFFKKMRNKKGLNIFTFRQIQEIIFLKSNSLAVSSLLMLMALCLFGFGVSYALNSGTDSENESGFDYTFIEGERDIKEKEKILEMSGTRMYMDKLIEIKIGAIDNFGKENFSLKSLVESIDNLENLKNTEEKIFLKERLEDEYLQIISETGYNSILELKGKSPLKFEKNQVAFYMDPDIFYNQWKGILGEVLKENAFIEIKGEKYDFKPEIYNDTIALGMSYNIGYAIIVQDELFDVLMKGNRENIETLLNATLKEEIVKKNGLMNTMLKINEKLDKTPMQYEGYLQTMARSLVYAVSGSYITIYLGIIFLIIGNTVIGVQFLIQHQKAEKKYRSLIGIGSKYKDLKKSVNKQIRYHFGFPLVIAAISSFFGLKSMMIGLFSSQMEGKTDTLLLIGSTIILLVCLIEIIYIISVMRLSNKHLLKMIEE